MRVLFDLNVVLDVVADREPFADDSRAAMAHVEQGTVEGWMAAHSLTTLFYLVRRRTDLRTARRATASVLTLFDIVPVDKARLTEALAGPGADFEDAVQIACAQSIGAHYIVTRDPRDFRKSHVPALSPLEFLATVAAAS